MIKEEKLMLNGIKLTREQINNYRRKKLKEVRKNKGVGRPKRPINYVPRHQLNAMRDRELNQIAQHVNYY
tara:strand:- start:3228 stop:3437 length:210 start_codon:yes stop_codon:yes gene_type:complete